MSMKIKGTPRQRTGIATVDGNGYVLAGGVKVVRVGDGHVHIYDKNRHRSGANGGNQIAVPVESFIKAVRKGAAIKRGGKGD